MLTGGAAIRAAGDAAGVPACADGAALATAPAVAAADGGTGSLHATNNNVAMQHRVETEVLTVRPPVNTR